jgi:hypothetical protein
MEKHLGHVEKILYILKSESLIMVDAKSFFGN